MEPICLDSQESYTVGWIAALRNERAAAEAMCQEEHKKPRNFTKAHNDPNAYSWGRIGDHNVVIASLPEGMDGKASAATTASYMLASFTNIRIGLMVGIGAGVPETEPNIHLGDVVVSRPEGTSGGVIQYDLGKSKAGEEFERKGYLNAPPVALLSALAKIRARHERKEPHIERLVNNMLKSYPLMSSKEQAYNHPGVATDRLFKDSYHHVDGSDCSACAQDPDNIVKRDERTEPAIYYGVIASGDQVIKDAKKRQKVLRDACQSCICIEMEAAGLMNSFPCLVIRGICDYADSHKNDIWHNYAAATAAAYARELLEIIDVDDVKKTPKASETVKDTQPKLPLVVDKVNNDHVPQDDLEKLWNRIRGLDAELDKLKRELKTNNNPDVQDDLEKLQKRVGELEDLKPSEGQERATSPRIECGHATITRKPDGSGTPIHFKKPFARRPVVLVTIRFNQSSTFYNQRAYLLQDCSSPASTTEHFVAGCWGGDSEGEGGPGQSIEFDWIAIEPNE